MFTPEGFFDISKCFFYPAVSLFLFSPSPLLPFLLHFHDTNTLFSMILEDSSTAGADMAKADPEMQQRFSNIPDTEASWRIFLTRETPTTRTLEHSWAGSGTTDDPFLVEFLPHDVRNPKHFTRVQKWTFCTIQAVACLSIAMASSAYSGGIKQVIEHFHCDQEVATLGLALFVLGYALGPLLWAPLSELYGRQVVFFITFGALTAFNVGTAVAQNIETLLVLRFLGGTFGSSPFTNAGGVISDLFDSNERGLVSTLFAAAPSLGPALGPIIGGFMGMTVGWRWIMGLLAIMSGVLWLMGSFLVPETYAPVLLQHRAAILSKHTGKVYISALDKDNKKTPGQLLKVTLLRPWQLLFREPICLLSSIYIAIVYGILYLSFGAFPIVFEGHRGWNQGVSGLAFLGVAVGMFSALCYYIWDDNHRFIRLCRASPGGIAPPEARLPPTLVASVALPIGLFWFAWTNYPSIHWIVPIMATVPFGFGLLLLFLSLINYLIDCYLIYAASVLAANSVLRSLLGFAFPLFTRQMFQNLGIHWGSTIPAALAAVCVPFPFLFYKYGEKIRLNCKYAAEAAEFAERMKKAQMGASEVSIDTPPAAEGGEKADGRSLDEGEIAISQTGRD